MRRRNGVRAAAVLAVVAATAAGQDAAPRAISWPLKKIDFPVPVADIQRESRRPKALRFYVAKEGGRFDQVAEKPLDQLETLNAGRGQKGFSYTADRDGVYDFAVMFVYPDGTTEPRESSLMPEWRVTFDTRPPALEVRQSGPARLDWEATDEHLAANPVTVETRWPGGRWLAVSKRFGARDGYTWLNLKESEPLEVRVIARDRGGLEAASRVFTLPGKADGNRAPAPGDDPAPVPLRPESRSGGFGNPAEFDPVGQPPTEYVNRRVLTVESKLSRVTRSGVKKAYLWVNDGKTGWKLADTLDQNIPGNTLDQTIRMPFKAPADGLFGFLVIPESFAGTKQPDPGPGTPPQYYVYVDTQPPTVQVKRAEAGPGGATGPRVTIEWGVTEAGSGLDPDSITVEHGPTRNGPFKPVVDRKLENTGRYTWDVEDKSIWQTFVKVTATDRAKNVGSHVFDKEVFLDLERPAATIEKVVGSGAPGAPPPPPPAESSRADPVPPATPASQSRTTPPPAPKTEPTKAPPVGAPVIPDLGSVPVPPIGK